MGDGDGDGTARPVGPGGLGSHHWQTPATQVIAAPQIIPHTPQLFTSVWVSVQVPPQSVNPFATSQTHIPRQVSPALHVVPQAPQFAGSVAVSTQTPPQSVVAAGQPHTPAVHV